MCTRQPEKTRLGDRLADGSAHEAHHASWSRRQFMKGLGMVAAGASVSLAGTPVQAFGGSSLLSKLARLGTNRVLVMIQLSGGNDGLNTLVPINNDIYYSSRPGIAIPANSTLALTSDLGFHPSLAALEPVFGDGDMAIVQGVGYPDPNLSHFRSTDVWLTGDEAGAAAGTGWSGRHLDALYPEFGESPPSAPLAVQIGNTSALLFKGPISNMGMSLFSVDLFDRIAETGKFYSEDNIPNSIQGDEITFMRKVANSSFRYASSIQAASESGSNDVEYPSNSSLATNLSIVAQLIKGGLGTSIYHLNIGGFDTHANQLSRHSQLLTYIAEAVSAFRTDITAGGLEEEVLVMTFSEFGRRVGQNGSAGTDHGTAAPMFLFGAGVNGGMYGAQPSLEDLDNALNMKFSTDFRSVYSSILLDWFGLDPADVTQIFGEEFPQISFISSPTGVNIDHPSIPLSITLNQNYPNPFNPATTISFSLKRSMPVVLDVYDVSGRLVSHLIDSVLPSGNHDIRFEAGQLPSGLYMYQLRADGRSLSKSMTLLR
ncbi:MAG: hypothetical protein BMS9Abin05_0288 [Rhodothermia bacterium]|nr:MAG: hypothetical protein BMS9Abin05_0288 [Rhodothermia bacterium]